MAYRITNVQDRTRPWASQKGGPMMSYYLTLIDPDGNEAQNVELAQKATTTPPQPGQMLEGNLDNTEYGLRFKKAFAQNQGGGRGMSPEDRASIIRQHSQDMALRALELAATFGVIERPASAREFWELVEKTTGWFVKDAAKGPA